MFTKLLSLLSIKDSNLLGRQFQCDSFISSIISVLLVTAMLSTAMDKLQPTGRNLGRVFNSRGGHVYAMHLCGYQSKLSNLNVAQTTFRFSPVHDRPL